MRLPEVSIGNQIHEFGELDVHGEGTHTFHIKNVGKAPLKLTKGPTSCGCTSAMLAANSLAPGESTTVTLTWKADPQQKPEHHDYVQTSVIRTNDPRQREVTLTIKGRITRCLRADPPDLVISGIPQGESADAEIRLYCSLVEPLEQLEFEPLDPFYAKHFEVTSEPLSADQLKEEPDARSGHLIRITVKPTLPQAQHRHRIRVVTHLPSAPGLIIPVTVTVVKSDLSILARRGWNRDTRIFDFIDAVTGSQGGQRELLLVVRGPDRKDADLRVLEKWPEWLDVSFGETTPINELVMQTPMIVRIPPGTAPGSYRGTREGECGRVRIATGLPRMPELTIRVRFAVEE